MKNSLQPRVHSQPGDKDRDVHLPVTLMTRSEAASSLNLSVRINPEVQTEAAASSVELWRLVHRDEQTSVCSVTAAGFRCRGVFSDWVEM